MNTCVPLARDPPPINPSYQTPYYNDDHQVVCGIMGFYTTLYLISKLFTGGSKKEEPGAFGVWRSYHVCSCCVCVIYYHLYRTP
jgi:hypothetical protein